MCKDMKEVCIYFEEYYEEVMKLKGFQKIDCHMIFDVNMGDNFRRKARLVAGGNTTEALLSMTYYSFVSHDSVRITLKISALN